MAFYAIDKTNTVRSSGFETETEAKRDALQNIGGLSFEKVASMSSTQVDQVLRSMAGVGVRVFWSDRMQRVGKPYKIGGDK